MKKILCMFVFLFLVPIYSFAWIEAEKGIYLDKMNFSENNISYLMKIDSTSPRMQAQLQKHNIQFNNQYNYMILDININCSLKTAKAKVSIYDEKNTNIFDFSTGNYTDKSIESACQRTKNIKK